MAGAGRSIASATQRRRLHHIRIGPSPQPPSHEFYRQPGDRHAVNAFVAFFKAGTYRSFFGSFAFACPVFAHPDGEFVALPRIAHVYPAAEAHFLGGHACGSQHFTAPLSHFAEHVVSLGRVDFSQQAWHGASQVKLHGRDERTERRKHPGIAREDDLRCFQQLSHPASMNRPSPAERYERGPSQVGAFLHGVHAGCSGHVLVHHFVDAGSHIRNAQAEVARKLGCGFFGEGGVQGHVAAEESCRRYETEQHIGIGHGRVGAPLRVAGGAGFGPRRLWPHFEQPQVVGTGDAASSCANLHEVYRRDGERQPRAVLEAVDAGDFQSGGEVGCEIVQQAGFGCGAAHVEAQQLRLVHPLGEPCARMRPCRRPRFHQAHRC